MIIWLYFIQFLPTWLISIVLVIRQINLVPTVCDYVKLCQWQSKRIILTEITVEGWKKQLQMTIFNKNLNYFKKHLLIKHMFDIWTY